MAPDRGLPLVLLALALAPATADDSGPAAPWIAGRLEPEWAGAKPLRTIRIRHDPARSDEQNGEALAGMLGRLEPGDRLEIGPGRYSVARKLDLSLRGTAEAPIWIAGEEEDRPPVITRPDARQNVLNVGERSRAEYICLRGLELTGGSTLIRFHDGSRIWLDRCHLHHAGNEGITTNTRDTSHFFITRNHFHDFTSPGATGEAMYLGGNHGRPVMSYSVIAGNHVHDCGGTQGDGIELKQGSHHNWIVQNHVHDTKYPCIIAYGTGGKGINVIERNVCYRSGDNVLQVQGEAIVRNNLLIGAAGAGLASTDHQGKTRRLEIVHNTIVSRRRGANLSSWNDREGMVFANNIVYTDGGEALRFPGGSRGVTVAGNVVAGSVQGVDAGFAAGRGLEDLEDVSWDGATRLARPRTESPAAAGADDRFRVEVDLTGSPRGARAIAGAHDIAPRDGGDIPFTRVVVDPEPPSDPWYKMHGDIDGDGDEDIVIGGRSGRLTWYEHPGWKKSVIAPGGWSGVNGETGDVDGDGDIDIVMGGIVWFRNPRIGGGSWVRETLASFKAHDIELGDLDGDGKPDVVARDQSAFGESGDEIRVYRQVDPSSWSRRVIPCPHGEGLETADLDRDGDIDLVIGARWYENDGEAGGAWKERVYAVSHGEPDVKAETGDLNGDGRIDIVLAPAEKAGEESRLSWFEAPEDPRAGDWTEHAVAAPVEAVHHSLACGDLDGDGDIDIATAEMHQGADPDEVAVHRNLGGGASWGKQVLSARGSHDIILADIGGDGDLDIVGANWSGGFQPVELWVNGSAAGGERAAR